MKVDATLPGDIQDRFSSHPPIIERKYDGRFEPSDNLYKCWFIWIVRGKYRYTVTTRKFVDRFRPDTLIRIVLMGEYADHWLPLIYNKSQAVIPNVMTCHNTSIRTSSDFIYTF